MRRLLLLSMRQLGVIFSIALLLFSNASALSQAQRDALGSGARYINVDDADNSSCDATDADATDAPTGKDTAKWQTTLTPPYSLEDFVVEVLRDIAAKEGVPESDTVTKQHVLAMVAFAWGEGGNLTNTDIYNPWNSGYIGPGVNLSGPHSVSGVQSYASFDDGVEAIARAMTGTGGSNGYQSRLGDSLKDPTTTAQQFMKTLTYYQRYKGNLAWAALSEPPNADKYYQARLALVAGTAANYKHEASELIGPPGDSDYKNLHSTHPLRYSFSGDDSSSSGSSDDSTDSCSAGGVVANNIIQTALNLAWTDYPKHGFDSKDPKPSYLAAVKQYNSGLSDYTDCGGFVSTVLRATGIDPNYPSSGTGGQLEYVEEHPGKYQLVGKAGQWTTADLHPGDILLTDGHSYIYVGDQTSGTSKQSKGFSVVEASQGDHVPELDRAEPYATQDIGSGLEKFAIVRIKS